MLRNALGILCSAAVPGAWTTAQVVEEFYPAIEPPGFAEEPKISGQLVVWQRYGDGEFRLPDTIQCQDITQLDDPIVDLGEYPANKVGVLLSHEYLFHGAYADTDEKPLPVVARRIGAGCNLGKDEILVNEFGRAVGVSERYVFLTAYSWPPVPEAYRGTLLAKPLDRLSEPGTEALITVARRKKQPDVSRTEVASDRYFVWQDLDPNVEGDTWKLYILDLSQGLPAQPTRIVDTHLPTPFPSNRSTQGVYLDLSGSYLVFQGAEEHTAESASGIYFVDLDQPGEPFPIETTVDPTVNLTWPAVSDEFVVWTRMTNFFRREAFAFRLEDGKIFSLGPGGSWIRISGNITVANGYTGPQAGPPSREAIVARELDLPGAPDVGDANGDSRLNITDAVFVLSYLFSGGSRPRLRLADADHNGRLDVGDAISILQHLFLSGPKP